VVNREKSLQAGKPEAILITRRSLVQIQLPQPIDKEEFQKP